jgi:hypothetical protein
MRLAIVSLMALAAGANAFAQTPAAAPAANTAPAPAATPAPPPPPPAAPAPQAAPPAPAAPSAGAQPVTAPPGATTPTAETPPPPSPPPPPPPPPPPTDPTAIAVLDVLQKVCIPAAGGGNFAQIAKGYGLRKQGDYNWVEKQKDFTLTVEDPGSNPTQCHVDLVHPADVEAPGRPIIIALNDWAAVERGWSLYRNDKNVQGTTQFTTRSWQLDWNGQEQSLVFTTMRKPDGTPSKGTQDTSQLIYGVQKSPS